MVSSLLSSMMLRNGYMNWVKHILTLHQQGMLSGMTLLESCLHKLCKKEILANSVEIARFSNTTQYLNTIFIDDMFYAS